MWQRKNENQEKTGETAKYKIRAQRIAVYSHFNYRNLAAGGSRANVYLFVPLFCWRVVYFMLVRFIGVRSLTVLEEKNPKPFNETKGRVVLYHRKHIAAFSRAAI